MKFVRYEIENHVAYGMLDDDTITEIQGSIFSQYKVTAATCLLKEVRLLSPVAPSKLICVGQDHLQGISHMHKNTELPSHSMKPPSAFIGPGAAIRCPQIGANLSHRGQLAVVIKDRIRNISEKEALDHVLGYTCLNDIIDLDLTAVDGQWFRAQAFDTFAPFGPCVATDLDPSNSEVQTFVNGQLVQSAKCSQQPFPVSYLVHYISQAMTLLPGDLIGTGTPIGGGPLRPGDLVEVAIEGIGTLSNSVETIS